MITGRRAAAFALLSGIIGLCAGPAEAQRDGPGGILRGWIAGRSSEAPGRIEEEARSARDAARAESLYAVLFTHHSESTPGVRAALWLGLRRYTAGQELAALSYFEAARRKASDPQLRAEATFWCEQARRVAGLDPLPDLEPPVAGGIWGTLLTLVAIDRTLWEGKRREAEDQLLSIEGDLRRAGLQGLAVARWTKLLELPGVGRIGREELRPLLDATRGLPEQLRDRRRPERMEEPAITWSLQFGASLQPERARQLRRRLRSEGLEARIDESRDLGATWYRVRVGDQPTRAEIDSLAARVAQIVSVPFRVVRIR